MSELQIPDIPPPEEMENELRSLRYRVDIPQSELADEIGVSPSQISKIENDCERAKYGDIYRILTVLSERASDDTEPVISWLDSKRETRSEDYRLEYLSPEDTVREAKNLISDLDISQLPVIDSSGSCIGAVRAEDLVSTSVSDDDSVEEHMSRRLREIAADVSVSEVRRLFSSGSSDAVLVRAEGFDREAVDGTRYLGILTPADFADIDSE